jgi:predicted transcriptional regulator
MWLSQAKSAKYLGICNNTFTKYVRKKYPPDRIFRNRFEWKKETLDKIKDDKTVFTT